MARDPQRRAPVMADVAQRAGVSHQTVSRVLNGHLNVRESTRARVLAAIDELAYRPNSSARALATRRTRVLGVIAFDTTLYGPASTLFGIEQAARAAGYFVSIASLKAITERDVNEALDHLAEQAVDGLIVIAPQRQAVAALAGLPPDLPVVAVEGGEAPDRPVVCVDQEAGATAVTRHLLDLGHETVVHVAGPDDWLEAQARRSAWEATLRDAGAPVPEVLRGDWSPHSGYEAGRELSTRDDVSAVFVANDQMALGLLRAYREAGIEVPGRVSVAGFDDIPEAAYFYPPLTTVRQDFAEVGRRSIALLLDEVGGRDNGRIAATGKTAAPRVVAPAHLIVRASTGERPR